MFEAGAQLNIKCEANLKANFYHLNTF